MTTGMVRANGVELWHETFGDPDDPTVVLIMGAGMPALYWPTGFCQDIASRGRYVVRFDNRDVGLSTWFDDLPSTPEELEDAPPYGVADMAADTLGLLEELGIVRAHLVGASLGGIIAEAAAVAAPQRVASVTLLGTTPPFPREVFLGLWRQMLPAPPPPGSRDELIERSLAGARAAVGPGHPFEEDRMRTLFTEMVDRGWNQAAGVRHAAAGFFSPRPGVDALAATGVPTLILHGTADAGYDGMRDYADRHGHASFVALDGVGHELPTGVWKQVVDAVVDHTAGSKNAGAGQ